MSLFWIEPGKEDKSYSDFISDLNSLSSLKKNIYTRSNYDIILSIIAGLLTKNDIVLLDKDFSKSEMENLGIESSSLENEIPVSINIKNTDDLFSRLKANTDTSTISLFTSGTTGRPKMVTHFFRNIIRNVKTGEKFKNNVWAFAYNLTHFAGLQVLFQAFLNENLMIYTFESSPADIVNLINKYKVTNISATPSFYRMVLPVINSPETVTASVKRVTLGGEKYDPALTKIIQQKFPDSKITNIYASTEAGSLFNSSNEIFTIEDESKIIINSNNELLIHKSLLGVSASFVLEGDWYNTGDIVEKTGDNSFRFVARKKDYISIGGYKINPLEIEDKIKELDFINDVKVLARDNSLLGSILVANIVLNKEKDEKEAKREINTHLKNELQKWKIPSMYNFTDKLSLTRTGKKVLK